MTAPVKALVDAATSGAVFCSTDGPQGAWVWRLRGAAWVCETGDTGWHSFASSLAPGITVAEGESCIKRTPRSRIARVHSRPEG